MQTDYFLSVRELAHEVSHPLTAASLHLQQLNREIELIQPEIPEGYTEAFHQRISSILLSLEQAALLLQTDSFSVKQDFLPYECIQGIMEVLQPVALAAGCLIVFSAICKRLLKGNSIYFNQIVNNLIYNSIDAYKSSTKAKDRLILISLKEVNSSLALIVQDFAGGIPRENISKIFTLGYSSKGEKRGVGLALVKRLVEEEFVGEISVSSQIDQGTRFVVSFPLWYNTREPKTAPLS